MAEQAMNSSPRSAMRRAVDGFRPLSDGCACTDRPGSLTGRSAQAIRRGFACAGCGGRFRHGLISVSCMAGVCIVGHGRRFVSIEKENRFEATLSMRGGGFFQGGARASRASRAAFFAADGRRALSHAVQGRYHGGSARRTAGISRGLREQDADEEGLR